MSYGILTYWNYKKADRRLLFEHNSAAAWNGKGPILDVRVFRLLHSN